MNDRQAGIEELRAKPRESLIAFLSWALAPTADDGTPTMQLLASATQEELAEATLDAMAAIVASRPAGRCRRRSRRPPPR